jgi:hypothetical protein
MGSNPPVNGHILTALPPPNQHILSALHGPVFGVFAQKRAEEEARNPLVDAGSIISALSSMFRNNNNNGQNLFGKGSGGNGPGGGGPGGGRSNGNESDGEYGPNGEGLDKQEETTQFSEGLKELKQEQDMNNFIRQEGVNEVRETE